MPTGLRTPPGCVELFEGETLSRGESAFCAERSISIVVVLSADVFRRLPKPSAIPMKTNTRQTNTNFITLCPKLFHKCAQQGTRELAAGRQNTSRRAAAG